MRIQKIGWMVLQRFFSTNIAERLGLKSQGFWSFIIRYDGDLGNLFLKLTPRASFWYTIYPISNFEIWTIFCNFCLPVTSGDLVTPFFEKITPKGHFYIQFTHFQWISKFDPQIWNYTPLTKFHPNNLWILLLRT